MTRDEKNNPFGLYQGYLDIVKPIEYEQEKTDLYSKIDELANKLESAEEKSDMI